MRVLGGVGSDAWVAFSTALAGGLHALEGGLARAANNLALFFGDAPFGADAARKLGDPVCGPRRGSRRTERRPPTEMIRQSHNSSRARSWSSPARHLALPVADERHRALSVFFVTFGDAIRVRRRQ